MPAQMSQTPGSPGSSGSSPPGLNLSLSVPDRVPLNEALIAVATLTNGADWPVNTSGRLNLAEGDLDVVVTGPDGSRTPAGWPWPADSAARRVELGPGQALMGGVLLLSAAGVAPLFPTAGQYDLIAEYSPSPGQMLRSEPVTVVRIEPGDETGRKHRRALENPQVAQSLASASYLGDAAEMLADLQRSGSPVTRLIAGLAAGDTAAIGELIAEASGQVGAATAAAAVASVLPDALASGDERLRTAASVLAVADDDGRAAAILRAEPWPQGRT